MRVEMFDDWKSIIHSIAGGLSYFSPLSLSYSWHIRLQNTSSYERIKHTLSATLRSSLQATRSSDYYMNLLGG